VNRLEGSGAAMGDSCFGIWTTPLFAVRRMGIVL
jgi:hypothetical protein